jgi:hypothetical protein
MDVLRQDLRFAWRSLMARRGFTLVVAAVAIGACGEDDARSPGVTEHDSAGVRIVESSSAVWDTDPGWRLSSEPTLQIGSADGDPAMQLHRVRTVRRSVGGDVYVLNAGTHEVRVYSSTGQHVRTIGREGGGPGEFRFPINLWHVADTLLVVDLDRASFFDAAGNFVRTAAFGTSAPSHLLEDGRFLRVGFAAGQNTFELAYSRPRMAIIRSSLDGEVADTVAGVSGSEFYRISPDGRGIASYSAPFGHQRMVAVHGNSILTGDGSTFEVRQLDADGRLVRIMRRPGTPAAIDASSIRAFEQAMLETAASDLQRQRWNQLFREWSYPDSQPVYDQLLVSTAGDVWVRHFAIGQQPTARWSVFDPAGRWLGEVTTPGDLVVMELGEDHVLGLWTDDYGVEYVRVYAVDK